MATTSTSKPPARLSFFPKADAGILAQRGPLPPRPQTTSILDYENLHKPIAPWSPNEAAIHYPPKADEYASSPIPRASNQCLADRYLRATLAENERLRLSMLWYYTHNINNETEFLAGLQEKLSVAQESTGWEYVVIGILDINIYIRLATIGLPLGILPRGETICAHTVTQPPGSVFLMPDMNEDWRFRGNPFVELGGLVAYAGVPLRVQDETGDTVGLGTLCVCSSTSQPPLTKAQQSTLTRIADWVVSDMIQCTRARRQRDRQRMTHLLAASQQKIDAEADEGVIIEMLKTIYPATVISLQPRSTGHVVVDGRDPISFSDLEDGIWEDVEFLDEYISSSNHQDFPSDRVVRLLSARCESALGSSLLVVTSKDYRMVFDDIDSWFVQACATMCTQIWNKRLLAEALKTKEKFLRGFSHQLRTPIHGILGSAELLSEELRSKQIDEEVDWMTKMLESFAPQQAGNHSVYLETIKASGRDLISIVNNMINLNKWVDVAMRDRSYTPCSIEQLEHDLAHELSKAAAGDTRYKAPVIFRHNIPSDHSGLKTEMTLLRDSLLPLIINAIQNTRNGVVTVTTSIHPGCKELQVDVEDTGCGIHPDDQVRIFEPYEKIDAHTTGAGLGLTLASKFATLLRGSITLVTSEVGRGSHFRAAFHDIESQYAPRSSQPLASQLQHLPARFHHISCSPESTLLADFVTRFASDQGFVPSSDQAGCFIILDFVPDLERFRAQLSQISSRQVIICPIPTIDSESSIDTWNNVVYVRGPFMASTLSSALDKADALASKMNASLASPQLDAVSSMLSQTKISEITGLDAPPMNVQEPRTPPCTDAPTPSKTGVVTPPRSRRPSAQSIPTDTAPIVPSFPTPEACAKPTALLVDDNTVNLRILQMYCKKRGLSYMCAEDGKQAVELFTKQQAQFAKGEGSPISLILMDLQMPVCNGIEATKQIRALERQNEWGRSVVFVVTGQDSLSDRSEAEDAEADSFYVKPVAIKTLDVGIKRHFPLFEAS